jgi:hypothetical protein
MTQMRMGGDFDEGPSGARRAARIVRGAPRIFTGTVEVPGCSIGSGLGKDAQKTPLSVGSRVITA